MKKEIIEEAITNINDKYIKEAAEYDSTKEPCIRPAKVKKQNFFYRHYALTTAACLLVALIGTYVISNSFWTADGAAKEVAYEGTISAYYGSIEKGDGELSYSSSTQKRSGSSDLIYGSGGLEADQASDSKIIYTANITGQTKEFEKATDAIEKAVASAGGFLQSKQSTNYNDGYRNVSYVIRVPKTNFNSLITELTGACNVTSSDISGDDITETYYDIESRLKTQKIKLERLQELLEKADNMTDIITIENSISDTEAVIESLQSQLNNFDSQVEYSTIYFYLTEVYKEDTVVAPLTFGEKLAQAFEDGIENFGNFCEDFVIWLAESWIVLLVFAAIGTTIVLIIKKKRKKEKTIEN